MPLTPLQIHVIADSTGESAARIARAAQAQFPETTSRIVRHPRAGDAEALLEILDRISAEIRNSNDRAIILYTLVKKDMAAMVDRYCKDKQIPHADLFRDTLNAFEKATGQEADEVMARPVGVEADYFDRISAMEFAVRNDDGVTPEGIREADIVLVGASRSGKTPLSLFLGYVGYKTTNVPLVPGIEPPKELFEIEPWRIVGLTIDAERLLAIRTRRVKGLGGYGRQDGGYADLAKIYDELDEVAKIQKKLGCPVIDTTGLALEEAATRVVDIVDERAKRVGASLRSLPGSLKITP